MRNQAIIAAAIVAAALTGCGGAGSGSSSDSSTSTTATTANPTTGDPGFAGATVNLKSTPGQIELAFLTGQARNPLAPGDVEATLGRVVFTDSDRKTILGSEPIPSIGLNSYNRTTYRLNAPVLPLNWRLLNEMELQVSSVRFTDAEGEIGAPFSPVANTPIRLSLDSRLYPNRYTSVPVFLNDAQFVLTDTNGDDENDSVSFDRDQFEADNGIGEGRRQRVPSFLSDYLRFDLSGMPEADRPLASDGLPADYVLFSGDNYALAANRASTVGSGLLFNSVNLGNFAPDLGALIPGTWKDRDIVIEPGGVRNTVPGTYDLRQPNPIFDPRVLFITSVAGIFKDFGDMFQNINTVQAVSFPSIRDDNRQDLIVASSQVSGTGRTVNAMYFGYLDYDDNSVHLFPIENLSTASTEGEVVGTFTNTLGKTLQPTRNVSSVRYGTWNVALPGIGASTGIFTVYRN